MDTGTELRTLEGHTGAITSVDFSVDGSLMATASADQSAKLWDPATGEEIETLHHLKDVNSVLACWTL